MTDKAPFALGWEEWAKLPALGLPALKVKVDTGARTSALHAFDIESFGPSNAPMVRFNIHPVSGREDIVIACSAKVVDRREVTSSNGETELRYVITTDISIGARTWPIEITLTNRTNMAYRMLLGRQAIADDMIVTPSESFCQSAGMSWKCSTPRAAIWRSTPWRLKSITMGNACRAMMR